MSFQPVTRTVTKQVIDKRATAVALTEARKAKGYSLTQLAKAAGISVALLSLLESGQRGFSKATIDALSKALNN